MALDVSQRVKNVLFTAFLSLALVLPVGNLLANADREPAKKFSLNDLTGEQIALEDFQGQVLLVNFWATWCPPCVHELPSIQALKDHFSDQSFEVLALNMGERGKDIENFL
ncbi:MAG: TlpA family protein disulfide reductase, partial [Acidiferrobacterales bacterium]|nr:TlpA family protein disulfide reductase [Acidiferrobacterales bacterium]